MCRLFGNDPRTWTAREAVVRCPPRTDTISATSLLRSDDDNRASGGHGDPPVLVVRSERRAGGKSCEQPMQSVPSRVQRAGSWQRRDGRTPHLYTWHTAPAHLVWIHEAGLIWTCQLGSANGKQSLLQVDVLTLKSERLADAQPRHSEQAEQAIIGLTSQAAVGLQGASSRK